MQVLADADLQLKSISSQALQEHSSDHTLVCFSASALFMAARLLAQKAASRRLRVSFSPSLILSLRSLRLQDGWNFHKVQSILGAAITAVNHSDNICRPLPPRRLDGNGKGGQGAKSWPIKTAETGKS
ncbi:hypothetical protein ILYODFUR_004422 [Ilyodon furcidens]|uniref:Uncharacterized protein n=1 Tax=Ilyodon furcidens TaxID=33524 RepID=A0ABV0U2M3_9TELE